MIKIKKPSPRLLGQRLLDWYDANARELPWRATSDETADPYHVWLSEIMLQQTTVPTVIPYFANFVARWPSVHELAKCDLDDVLHAWQGLGYYARARNLHKCAGVVSRELGGVFPDTEAGLLCLPGIGPYTAAAIVAIAFGGSSVPVDGNIERVISRLHALDKPVTSIKVEVADLARKMLPAKRPGDFAQAMMDLGATICRPKSADCQNCPWQLGCRSGFSGDWVKYPVKPPKKIKPVRNGFAFWLVREDGAVYLRRRPEKGLLGSMTEVPSTEWREQEWEVDDALKVAPSGSSWRVLPGEITHTFTHFHLRLGVVRGKAIRGGPNDGFWSLPDQFGEHALPTLMKKIVRHALESTSRNIVNFNPKQ